MRRFLAFLVAAVFLGAPLLQLRCVIACAMEEAAEPADACHADEQHAREHAASPTIGASRDCCEQATPAAIVVISRDLTPDALPPASSAAAVTTSPSLIFVSAAAALPPGGPPAGLFAPLRL
jgi:hypothetical protein